MKKITKILNDFREQNFYGELIFQFKEGKIQLYKINRIFKPEEKEELF